jgi:uncharacterized protein YbaA (DUF1428 family)
MVTDEPATAVLPKAGEVIVDFGGVVSVEAIADNRPLCSVTG